MYFQQKFYMMQNFCNRCIGGYWNSKAVRSDYLGDEVTVMNHDVKV